MNSLLADLRTCFDNEQHKTIFKRDTSVPNKYIDTNNVYVSKTGYAISVVSMIANTETYQR